MNCPKCQGVMQPQSLDAKTSVDFCDRCKGMWLKKGLLSQAAGTSRDFSGGQATLNSAVSTTHRCTFCASNPNLMQFRFTPDAPLEVDFCSKCEGLFLDFKEFQTAVNLLRDSQKKFTPPGTEIGDPDFNPMAAYDQTLNRFAVPSAILLAFLMTTNSLTKLIGWYCFSIPIHECGHAIMGWLGGRFSVPIGAAIPMYAVTFALHEKRSAFVFLFLVATWGFIGYRAWLKRKPYPLVLSLVTIASAIYLTWIASEQRALMALTYGGFGGEFVLGTVLIVSFYYRMPRLIGWDFIRFIVLMAGASSYVSAWNLWIKIRNGRELFPEGSFLDGPDSKSGDINRLVDTFGWTHFELAKHFVQLGWICAAVIAVHYLWFLRKTFVKSEN